MSIDYAMAKTGQRMDVPVNDMIPLGDPDEVRAVVSRTFPELDWSGHKRAPSVGVVFGVDQVFDFCLHYERMYVDWEAIAREGRLPTDDEAARAHSGDGAVVMVFVHFSRGSNFIKRMRTLCQENGWTLWDMQTGKVVDFNDEDQHTVHESKVEDMVRRLHE